MNKFLSVIGLMLLTGILPVSGQPVKSMGKDTSAYCISQEEVILYNLVNDFRRQNRLPVIPLSMSLSIVSRTHIDDLLSTKQQDKECGLHSWSDKGKWKPCCYNKDPMASKCMNVKPFEITGYQGLGFELVYWDEGTASANEAYGLWTQVDASRDMILNTGKWQFRAWKAMGVGIRDGYAVIWLGDKPDLPANIGICGKDTLIQIRKDAAANIKPQTRKEEAKPANKELAKVIPTKAGEKKPAQNLDIAANTKKADVTVPAGNHFFVIVASAKTEELAMQKIKELKSQGYTDAFLLPSSERFRVSLGSYSSEHDAKVKIKEMKYRFPDCWLFKN
ncbi:MAG: SPOR domain-containing protein [Bacteroidetes bacterium]|nr:SPOR domain-containing protein [Bacteroidota bacterium]